MLIHFVVAVLCEAAGIPLSIFLLRERSDEREPFLGNARFIIEHAPTTPACHMSVSCDSHGVLIVTDRTINSGESLKYDSLI